METKDILKRNWPLFALGLILVIWFVFTWLNHYFVEDAYISFRFVRNLVQGNGLVFNVGERAEGYSNLLWILLTAAGGIIGIGIETMGLVLGLISGGAILILCWLIIRKLYPLRYIFQLIAVCIAALYFSLAYWAGSGLETSLFSALLLAAVFAYLKDTPSRFPWTGLWLGLLALTRTEGLAYTVVFVVHYLWMRRRGKAVGVSWRDLVVALALPAAQLIFRLSYYGLWLPLPAYVKAGGTYLHIIAGVKFIYTWAWGTPVILLLILAVYGVIKRWRESDSTLLALLLGAVFVFVVYSGGDLKSHYRFLLPAYLFLIVLGICGLVEISKELNKKRLFPRILTGGLVLWCGATFLFNLVNQYRHPREWLTVAGAIWLKENVPPDTYVASGAMGRLPYFSELSFIDYYGLCNVEIALHGQRSSGFRPGHDVGDAEVVFREEPGLIVIRPLPVIYQNVEKWLAGEYATTDLPWDKLTLAQQLVLSHPRLEELYQPVIVEVTDWLPDGSPDTEPLFLSFYVKRGELEELVVDRGALRVFPERPVGMP